METQEFFKKWKSDSPKSFEGFRISLEKQWYPFDDTYIDNYGNFWIEMGDDRKSELPFEMLTGIIEKFFEDRNLSFLFVKNNETENINFNKWVGEVIETDVFIESEPLFYNTKTEAQISAYLKAAEILEKELD